MLEVFFFLGVVACFVSVLAVSMAVKAVFFWVTLPLRIAGLVLGLGLVLGSAVLGVGLLALPLILFGALFLVPVAVLSLPILALGLLLRGRERGRPAA
jgi:hypothetical protein